MASPTYESPTCGSAAYGSAAYENGRALRAARAVQRVRAAIGGPPRRPGLRGTAQDAVADGRRHSRAARALRGIGTTGAIASGFVLLGVVARALLAPG